MFSIAHHAAHLPRHSSLAQTARQAMVAQANQVVAHWGFECHWVCIDMSLVKPIFVNHELRGPLLEVA